MKVNNLEIEKYLKKINNNIHGISCPFITKATCGPISNYAIKKSFNIAKKL